MAIEAKVEVARGGGGRAVRRCLIGKAGSVVRRLELGRHAVLGDEIPAVAGTVVAGRVCNDKSTYNTLENEHGRPVVLQSGDIVAGALGHRDALHGYAGRVPDAVQPGDRLQLLNLGGVIGTGAEPVPGLGGLTRKALLDGGDPPLEAALEWIRHSEGEDRGEPPRRR